VRRQQDDLGGGAGDRSDDVLQDERVPVARDLLLSLFTADSDQLQLVADVVAGAAGGAAAGGALPRV
jgi:hypothetical protein